MYMRKSKYHREGNSHSPSPVPPQLPPATLVSNSSISIPKFGSYPNSENGVNSLPLSCNNLITYPFQSLPQFQGAITQSFVPQQQQLHLFPLQQQQQQQQQQYLQQQQQQTQPATRQTVLDYYVQQIHSAIRANNSPPQMTVPGSFGWYKID